MADADTVRRFAPQLAPDEGRIVIYGYSLGGLPAVQMADTLPGCATVLEAPFGSFEQLVSTNTTLSLGERFFSDGRFDNLDKMRRHEAPVFVMVGEDDRTTPPVSARAVFDAAPGPKEYWSLPGVAHGIRGGGVPEAGLSDYLGRIRSFLEREAPACLLEL
jgi:fermentation-respiration switch protein FrsA (DUF1100 family)